ncbi:putative phosphorylase b kinase regulatory subunit alpha [Trichinella sp. T6]|nr:putative phosphorylase b kinase regulatory subunit alpha [Trichinella sp. T6]
MPGRVNFSAIFDDVPYAQMLSKNQELFIRNMHSRTNIGVRLDYYMRLVQKTILNHTDPVTSLFTSPLPGFTDHAWVRDNVYAVHAVWGLALAYKKNADFDEDRAKCHELEQTCVKVMRSLLQCFMRQSHKVEAFKKTQLPKDALHAKYSARNWNTVVGDNEWGHLQIDAISLYLLSLAQMTASGMQIIFTLDEVAFVQNLVFYIEHAYRIPDYGIWERGDKTNHGVTELNASSIGMAKAALQALNDLDLFGAYGSPNSVIHVMIDEIQQCQAVLKSLLPRESYSKETDAALLSIISYPAFALEDCTQISTTRATIMNKLQGRYGCRRFLRDGYKTPREDPNRLYYEPHELQQFENIECEWPLFFCYFILDGFFSNNKSQVQYYRERLEEIVITSENGLKLVPELYAVPSNLVDEEIACPHSQTRVATGSIPFLWAQSLYVLTCLIEEGFIQAAELDPLNRRLSTEKRPDTVVQVVVLAEDEEMKEKLAAQGIEVELLKNVEPFIVQPAHVLGRLFSQLGRSTKMKLSGRMSTDVGLLSTSKMYNVQDRILVFTPQFLDWQRFYLTHDVNILIDTMKAELFYVKTSWNVPGRPLVVMVFSNVMISNVSDDGKKVPLGMIGALKKMKSGYISGTRTILGKISDFVTTSCIIKLHYLTDDESNIDPKVSELLKSVLCSRKTESGGILRRSNKVKHSIGLQGEERSRKYSFVRGISQRHKSIMLDPSEVALMRDRRDSFVSSSSTGRKSSTNTDEEATPCSSPPVPLLSPTSPLLLRTSASGTRLNLLDNANNKYGTKDLNEVDCKDLVEMLLDTEILEEQADIVQYLWLKQGSNWDTKLGGRAEVTVRKLVEELYQKACHQRLWWLVRHTAGLLNKVTESLTNAVTDLLVRQKQITVGMPSIHEEPISCPLPPLELLKVIRAALVEDECGIMLTQEILIYLGMFIRTEPHLFTEMLRLRVGLIIQIMITELARGLHCSGEEAATNVTNLSPYELKTLLHHILSGKEFADRDEENSEMITYTEKTKAERTGIMQLGKRMKDHKIVDVINSKEEMNMDNNMDWLQWLRRRRIDGALNRVPPEFYSKIWLILRKCEGLLIGDQVLHQNLTQEMTTGEMKFALRVESVLNKIPDPEYRQLLVEALMVLTILAENQTNVVLGPGLVLVDQIVHKANEFFLSDQKEANGDAVMCCAKSNKDPCGGTNGICRHFYDSAPSGRYGTITYMCRAVISIMPHLGEDIECAVS